LLFVFENNQYGVNTSYQYSLAAGQITRMPEAYHIKNNSIYGNDVEDVYAAVSEAVGFLRQGQGPFFLECLTYRWHKHYLSSVLPDLRPSAELEEWKQRCPVAAYERFLLKQNILTSAEISAIKENILREVEKAHDFAVNSPFPEPREALENVYS